MQIVEFYSWVTDPFYHMFWNMLSENQFTNSSHYSNPKVDKLILSGLYEPDEAKRESISKRGAGDHHRGRAVGVPVRARLLRPRRQATPGLPALARPEPALLPGAAGLRRAWRRLAMQRVRLPRVGGRLPRYMLRRLALAALTLWLVTIVVFFITNILPGNPALVRLGGLASPEAVRAEEKRMGLDRPLPERYWDFVSGAVVGRLRAQLQDGATGRHRPRRPPSGHARARAAGDVPGAAGRHPARLPRGGQARLGDRPRRAHARDGRGGDADLLARARARVRLRLPARLGARAPSGASRSITRRRRW